MWGGNGPLHPQSKGRLVGQELLGASVRACDQFCRNGEHKGKGASPEQDLWGSERALPGRSWLSERLHSSEYEKGEQALETVTPRAEVCKDALSVKYSKFRRTAKHLLPLWSAHTLLWD